MCASEERIKAALSRLYPGEWTPEYSQKHHDQTKVFVLSRESPSGWIVLRNDIGNTAHERIRIDGIGDLVAHAPIDDPSFADLADIVSHFQDVRILRYRPGKRITLTARHPSQGDVIIKCVASGVDTIFARLDNLWHARHELGFAVSEPLSLVSQSNTFIQRVLTGLPIGFSDLAFDLPVVSQMAGATASLHESALRFRHDFTIEDQQRRSAKYLREIESRSPACAGLSKLLAGQLSDAARSLEAEAPEVTPIHGSLHNHQWLYDEPHLALVDFDRAGMGHPELDIATFLAQWDFEPSPLSTGIRHCFVEAYRSHRAAPINHRAISFYRAHKHLSKAYKACKQFSRPGSDDRISRRLASALSILGDPEELS